MGSTESSSRIITQEVVIKNPEDVIASLIAKVGIEDNYPKYVIRINDAVRAGDILDKSPQIIADLFNGGITLLFLGNEFRTNRTDYINKEDYLPAYEALLKEARPIAWPDWVAAPIIYEDLWDVPIGGVLMHVKNVDPEKFAQAVEILSQSLSISLERMISGGSISKHVKKYYFLNPDKLRGEGEFKDVTSVFLDIESFTPLSERTHPEELRHLLNRMFTPAIRIFQSNGGNIDKFTGDGLFMGFNYPDEHERPNSMAVYSALKTQEEVSKHGDVIKIRIGIHTGKAWVGRIGSTDPEFERSEITALGNTINKAQRIENAGKDFKKYFLISEDVKIACENEGSILECNYEGQTKAKGLSEMISVYSVTNIKLA